MDPTPSMLLAYDASGSVVATLDRLVARDTSGIAFGIVDFATFEAQGGKLRDLWTVETAVGSGSWPEFLGAPAGDFSVELDADKRISALVHKTSGHRRERAAIEESITRRREGAGDKAADIRDIVGGPTRPLALDPDGRTLPWTPPDDAVPTLPTRMTPTPTATVVSADGQPPTSPATP